MNIFISGGCKNGKSYHAQELARDSNRTGREIAALSRSGAGTEYVP